MYHATVAGKDLVARRGAAHEACDVLKGKRSALREGPHGLRGHLRIRMGGPPRPGFDRIVTTSYAVVDEDTAFDRGRNPVDVSENVIKVFVLHRGVGKKDAQTGYISVENAHV